MDYSKPKLAVLGEAACVIEQRPLQGKIVPSPLESTTFNRAVNPAYDLDE